MKDLDSYVNEYALEVENSLEALVDEYHRNSSPLSTDRAQGESLVNLLQQRLFSWRPWDTRIYLQYQNYNYQNRPTELTGLLYRHLKLGVLGVEDRTNGSSLEVGIFLNANMQQFEDYNKLVRSSWGEEIGFDPKTGKARNKLATKRGGFATSLASPSPHAMAIPENVLETDMLVDIPLPKVDWHLKAVWRIDVKMVKDTFVSQYKVSRGSSTLVEGRVESKSLSDLTRILMHQVFGNSALTSMRGDFGDGLRQLLAGEKSPSYVNAVLPVMSPSRPEAWSNLVDLLMRSSMVLLWVGGVYLAWLVLNYGWDIEISHAVTALVILAVGMLGTAALVPYAEARHKRAMVESLNRGK